MSQESHRLPLSQLKRMEQSNLRALRVETLDTIAAVSEADWDAVAGQNLFHTHRMQRVMEAHLRNYHPQYVLVYDRDQPIAVAIGAVPPPPHFFAKKFPPWLLALFERVASSMLAFCGVPLIVRLDGVVLRSDVTDTPAVLAAILDAFDRLTSWHKRLIQVYSSSQGADSLLHTEFLRRGYAAVPAVSYTGMAVGQWQSFDAYLQSLSSKRRIEIRRQMRKAAENGVTVRSLRPHDVAALDEELYRFYSQNLAAHDITRPWLDEGFFPALRTHLPENAVLIVAHVQDQFAGFTLGLHDQHTIDYPMLGLNTALAREYGVYFLMHYEMIRFAIDNGFRASYVGTMALDVKRRLGYRVNQRYYFLRSQNRFLDRSLQTLIRAGQTLTARWLGKDL